MSLRERNANLGVADKIASQIRRRILAGIYTTHAYLPSERKLAYELGTSRLTVSRAIAILEQENLVLRHAGRGTRVLPVSNQLSKPLVGVILSDPLEHRPELAGTMATLNGVVETLTRFHAASETIRLDQPSKPLSEDLLSRFGAWVSISPSRYPVKIAQRSVPLVMAKLEVEFDEEVSGTRVNHLQPTLKAVRTFVQMGHERIAFVGREPEFGFTVRALDGYKTGLREAGLPVDESLIVQTTKTDALSGYFAIKPLLRDPQLRPTAIVAARDTLAEGVCRAIEEAGLSIGHDVSVIGFDDITWPRERPFLTTFREPCYEMGAAAAEMLVERIVDPALPPESREFDVPFVLRRSAGPPMDNSMGTRKVSRQASASHASC